MEKVVVVVDEYRILIWLEDLARGSGLWTMVEWLEWYGVNEET